MSLLDRMERRSRWFAIPHLAVPLVVLQSLVWLLSRSRPEVLENLMLQRSLVMSGEWWRVISFLFVPPRDNLLWLFFELLIFWFMSAALENGWGAWRYNAYLLVGWIATVGCIFVAPDGVVGNEFLLASVLFAFAELYPDYRFYLFFLFPVQAKYFALVCWILLLVQFGQGDTLMRVAIIASVLNYFLFFTPHLLQRLRTGRRKMKSGIQREAAKSEAINTCIVCGATENSHPKYQFRYCPQCAGTPCYCMTHFEGHAHR